MDDSVEAEAALDDVVAAGGEEAAVLGQPASPLPPAEQEQSMPRRHVIAVDEDRQVV